MTEYTSQNPLITYDCAHGTEHTIPSDDVRVLKIGQAGFVIACVCGDEPLEEAHEPPHPGDRHLMNVYHDDPDVDEWLVLDDLADDWYDTNPWEPVEGKPGVWAQVRQRARDRAEEMANDYGSTGGVDGGEDEIDRAAREVECPNCGASEGTKCQRPSGHSVRKCHNARVEAAIEAGVIDAADTDRATSDDWIDFEQERFDAPEGDEHDPEPLATNDPPKSRQGRLGSWLC